MDNEQKQKKKLTYNELEHVAAQLQQQVADMQAQLRNVNEIREMSYICLQMLEHHEALPKPMLDKVLTFLDRLIPVPKDQQDDNKEE